MEQEPPLMFYCRQCKTMLNERCFYNSRTGNLESVCTMCSLLNKKKQQLMLKQCERNMIRQQPSGRRFSEPSYQSTQVPSKKSNLTSCAVRGNLVCKQIDEPIYIAKLLYHPLIKDCPFTPHFYSDYNSYSYFESITLSDSFLPRNTSSSEITI